MNTHGAPPTPLRHRQQAWMQALLHPHTQPLPPAELGCWSGGVRPADHALAVYINNVRANVLAALRLSYPLLLAVAGRAAFHRAALQGLALHPPRSGDLGGYGGWLPDLLAGQAPDAQQEAWHTLAQLEWQLDQARATPLGPAWPLAEAAQTLASSLAQDKGPALRPTLRAPSTLWALPEGAWALLCAHPAELQAQWLGTCTPDQTPPGLPPPTHLLQQGTRLLALDAAAHQCLHALQAGHSLQDATQAALAKAGPHSLLPQLLPTLLTHELLSPPAPAVPATR